MKGKAYCQEPTKGRHAPHETWHLHCQMCWEQLLSPLNQSPYQPLSHIGPKGLRGPTLQLL